MIEKNKSLAESDGVTIPQTLAEYTIHTRHHEETPDMGDLNLDSDYDYDYNDSDCYYSDEEEYEDDWEHWSFSFAVFSLSVGMVFPPGDAAFCGLNRG